MMPYSDEKLAEMKEDIASRTLAVKMKGMLVTGMFIALAAIAIFAAPAALVSSGLAPLVGMVGMIGSAVASVVTLKETKRLQMDEKYLESYMSGKNYWGKGYREEVAERGYSLGGPVPGFPPHGKDQNYRV
jgi:hypothetical protein